ncbi:lipid IV(A) palmitoyltransferase PagP [Rhodocyclus tenuis]|uniref:lipid IV(A) palmitoyltransferase PagP n=1 Tax=Rhodocyclus tenuis TaxID=1066 RepID=UPI0019044ACB|nr:lipid IV(A) palmitoyltransferase PagP [Rhodocyclus tenuis]
MTLPFRARPMAIFVCCAFSGAVVGGFATPLAAQGLTPLRVDPTLLGLPAPEPVKPAQRAEVKPVQAPAVEERSGAAANVAGSSAGSAAGTGDVSADTGRSATKAVARRASPGAIPSAAAVPAAEPGPVVLPVRPPRAEDAASADRSSQDRPLPVAPVVVAPALAAPVASAAAAVRPAERSREYSVPRSASVASTGTPRVAGAAPSSMAPLRVDPALLGLPASVAYVSDGGGAPPVATAVAGDARASSRPATSSRRARATGATARAAASEAGAPASGSWYDPVWKPLKNVWDVGALEFYLPFHTYHLRSSYTQEQIAGYQEKPLGFGIGRGLYNEKGNWEGIYTMAFQDSHFKPQYMAGYGWKTFWRPVDDVRLGLGYTAFLMSRSDVFGYVPFPGVLPIASLGYKNLSVETAFMPGKKGAGNIFFFWFKWELGKPGEAIGTPAPASAQPEPRAEMVAGPYRSPQSISASSLRYPSASTGGMPSPTPLPAITGTGSERPSLAPTQELLPPLLPATGPRDEEEVPDDLPPLALRPAKRLTPLTKSDESRPVFLTAERMYGQAETEMVAEGDAELRKVGTVVNADQLTYWPIDDEIDASGDVLLLQGDDVISGPHMRLRLQDQVGFFEQPAYTLKRQPKLLGTPTLGASASSPLANGGSTLGGGNAFFTATTGGTETGSYKRSYGSSGPLVPSAYATSENFDAFTPSLGSLGPRAAVEGRGEAERIDFEGENQIRITDGTYTTCKAGNDSWYAQASEMKLDYDREVGEGRHGRVYFKDVPILYSPWLTFSLNNQRKSGFLAPTFGSTSQGGFDFTVPYYWNIAPNMDATISPRVLSKRGLQVNSEFRYLDTSYLGQARLELLPNDMMRNENRYGLSLMHTQALAPGLSGMINYNRVSDDNYYTDLSSRIGSTSQTQLLRQGMLTWAPSGWWTTTLNVQSYQTLQPDPTVSVTRPYNLVPQVTFNARKPDWYNTDSSLFGQYTAFSNADPTKPEAKRLVVYPQVALPFIQPGWYVTPKIGVHATSWSLTRQGADVPDSINRTLPVFSVDAGMTFERPLDWLGKNFTQTLEPRLFYLNVPYQDQSKIPLFDSALADFNFAQIFAENQFTGQDRFNDANQLTAALTSRLIAPDSGREVIRAMLGQRYYFNSQQVTLNNTDGEKRIWTKSDLLAAVSGEVGPKIYADAAMQYNVEQARSERMTLGGRYLPEPGKVFNAAYRFNRDQIKQVDFSGQWPIGGGWYAVGRMNYSLKDQQPIQNIAGFEYNGGCWVLRVVGQRLATTSGTASSSFFVQLELNDFSRIGSNPLDVLKRNIQGYGLINQPTADPVFGQ